MKQEWIRRRFGLLLFAAFCFAACAKHVPPDRLIVATTHTLEDSGILDSLTTHYLLDHPRKRLELVVAGSGEVLTIGRRGDADALLTHAPDAEKEFVAAGYGTARQPVAHNEFLVVGPAADPAHIAAATSATDAFKRIVDAHQTFVSRADDSGTNKKELAVWKAAGVTPDSAHYTRAGTGMADALRIADERRAYILTDVATFLTLQHTLSLADLYHGDPMLRNDYSVIVVTKARNKPDAEEFAKWITSSATQRMIGDFGRAKFGRALFTADAVRQ